ncbi:MAG: PhoU domain-containing protein [Lentimicrobiaceae bacterium]|nr:PhoU domain-containing protein [Lentimicrobiaceae bacterium]
MNNDNINLQQPENVIMGIKDQYLSQLESDFQLLTEIVLSQMDFVRHMLVEKPSKEINSQIKRNEKLIDSLDITIKEKVINAIMLFTPRAGDLRRLMAYHDMTISMERVGDLITNISASLQNTDFSIHGFKDYKKLVLKMYDRAFTMLKNSLFAFTDISDEAAYSTILMDDKVDKMERKIEKRLADDFGGKTHNSQALLNIMNLNAISYHIERIADKAVDISTSAIFLIEGKDIRHIKSPKREEKPSTETPKNELTDEKIGE